MEIKKIAVIGSGAMGSGVVQVSAVSGYAVVVNDIQQAALDRAMAGIAKGLSKWKCGCAGRVSH